MGLSKARGYTDNLLNGGPTVEGTELAGNMARRSWLVRSPGSLLQLRFHTEAQLIAVNVVDIEVTHAVGVVLGLIQRSGASGLQLLV